MRNIYTIDFTRLAIRMQKKPVVTRSTRSMTELPEGFFDIGGPQDRIRANKCLKECLGRKPKESEVRMWELLGLKTMEEVKEHGFTAAEVMSLYSNQDLLRSICEAAQRLEEDADFSEKDVYKFRYNLQTVETARRRCL